jgi:hypothetical protein
LASCTLPWSMYSTPKIAKSLSRLLTGYVK